MRLLPSSLLITLLPAVAGAAEVTEVPPKWRADLHLAYTGSYQQVGLEEDGVTYAIRNTTRHEIPFRLEFAVYDGLAITLGLPGTAAQTITYPTAREMLFEPVTGQGSYRNGLALDPTPTIASGGFQGAWIGLAGQPFLAGGWGGIPLTARLDLAVRTPDPSGTLYSEARGDAPGGAALKLAAAFSAIRGPSEPYARLTYTHEFEAEVDVTGVDGSAVGPVLVKGPNVLEMRGGAELVAMHDAETLSRIAFDLYVGFRYVGPARQASGFWLPDVLDSGRSLSAVRSEYVEAFGGLIFDAHITKWIGLRAGAEGRYFSPHRVEHLYPVRTDPPSYGVMWTIGLTGKIRTKSDPR